MQKQMSKKSVIFVQNSLFNSVLHKHHKNEMSTSLHAVFNVVFGNVYFVIVFSNIQDRKSVFLKVVKTPYPKNRLWSF